MSRFFDFVGISLVVILVARCGGDAPAPEIERSLALHQGGFVELSGVADLRGASAVPVENPGLWLPQPAIPGEGWGPPGRGWHPVGGLSTLRYWRHAAGGSSLLLDLVDRRASGSGPSQVEVSLNGDPLGRIEISSGRNQHRLELRLGLLARVNDIRLEIDPPTTLVEGAPPLSLLHIGVESSQQVSGSSAGPSGYQPTQTGGLVVTGSGVYLVPWDVPIDAEQVVLQARSQSQSLVTHRLFVLAASGQESDLLTGNLPPGKWQDLPVSMGDWRGQRIVLGWEVDLSGDGGSVELGELRFNSSFEEPAQQEHDSKLKGDSAQRPDVVLIILDAARGDRFEGWDYPRQTLPNIDALGKDSLSFGNAFSECPTTSCSIPGMITGVPFLPGGEVGGGRQLAEQAKTLAEYLAEVGYDTVGFSATPNNSASHNLDQGFQVFRELWGRNNPDHGPFNMSKLAREVIESQPRDKPLYLQLHYLPPHQPYDPAPEFDRFTDPHYSGPIRPDMSLKPHSLGLADLEQEDLEHLIGLYDGNLAVADAAVAEVLAALKSTGRFDNSLIIITSDHGEAFMEHGRQGHNTTLFDEMLHVPLMVRLPQGEVPDIADQSRLASVLDIVPTVLGQVGASTAPEVGGQDLLRTVANPLRPRVLFFRTSHPRNAMLAARTPTWKAIAWPRHQVQMLYHLAEDPDELENLVGEEPLIFAGLGLRIRQHLQVSAETQELGEEVEMSEEATEALRSLGYLN